MAQQRVLCGQCGNQEAAGVRFCGRCGAPMQGGPAANQGAGAGRPRSQIATGGAAAGAGGGFTSNPAAVAAVLGVVAVVIVVAALLLSGGGDNKSSGGNTARGGGAGGDFPTPAAGTPTGPSTPIVLTIPTPTPQPQPTAVPPTSTPEPPPPTPVPPPPPEPTPIPPPPPPPEPTPIPPPPPTPVPPPPPGPVVPAAKTSNLVGLTLAGGGHGATYRIGTNAQLCYRAIAGVWVRVYDVSTNVLLFPEGVDDGQGACTNGTIDPPAGIDTIRIDAYTYIQQPNGTRTRGNFRDYASISIIVVP